MLHSTMLWTALCLCFQCGIVASRRLVALNQATKIPGVTPHFQSAGKPCEPLNDQGVLGFTDCRQLTGGRVAQTYVARNHNNQLVVVKSDSGIDWMRESHAMKELSAQGYAHMPRYDGVVDSKWVTMEFMEDPPWVTLGDFLGIQVSNKMWIKTNALKYEEAMQRFNAVVRATKDLHAKGWHHCDLHPGNLLVHRTDPGQVKLIDFGRADELSQRCERYSDVERLSMMLTALLIDAPQNDVEDMRFLREVLSKHANGQPFGQKDLDRAREIVARSPNLFDSYQADGKVWSTGQLCTECSGHEEHLDRVDAALHPSANGTRTALAQDDDPKVMDNLLEALMGEVQEVRPAASVPLDTPRSGDTAQADTPKAARKKWSLNLGYLGQAFSGLVKHFGLSQGPRTGG